MAYDPTHDMNDEVVIDEGGGITKWDVAAGAGGGLGAYAGFKNKIARNSLEAEVGKKADSILKKMDALEAIDAHVAMDPTDVPTGVTPEEHAANIASAESKTAEAAKAAGIDHTKPDQITKIRTEVEPYKEKVANAQKLASQGTWSKEADDRHIKKTNGKRFKFWNKDARAEGVAERRAAIAEEQVRREVRPAWKAVDKAKTILAGEINAGNFAADSIEATRFSEEHVAPKEQAFKKAAVTRGVHSIDAVKPDWGKNSMRVNGRTAATVVAGIAAGAGLHHLIMGGSDRVTEKRGASFQEMLQQQQAMQQMGMGPQGGIA